MQIIEQFEVPNKKDYNGRFHESRQIVKCVFRAMPAKDGEKSPKPSASVTRR